MFLKAKNVDSGENVLVAVQAIISVEAADKGTVVTLQDGTVQSLDLGFQSVSNRLKDLGASIA